MYHGGGARCSHENGCSKGAVGGLFCIRHGGGRRCLFDGCDRPTFRQSDYCRQHGADGKHQASNGDHHKRKRSKRNKIFNHSQSDNENGDDEVRTEDDIIENEAPKLVTVHRSTNSSISGGSDDVDRDKRFRKTVPSKEVSTGSNSKASKNLSTTGDLSSSVLNATLPGISYAHSVSDPRISVPAINPSLVPVYMPQAIGMSYNPYPIQGINGVPYFNPQAVIPAHIVILQPAVQNANGSSQNIYQVPHYQQPIP